MFYGVYNYLHMCTQIGWIPLTQTPLSNLPPQVGASPDHWPSVPAPASQVLLASPVVRWKPLWQVDVAMAPNAQVEVASQAGIDTTTALSISNVLHVIAKKKY